MRYRLAALSWDERSRVRDPLEILACRQPKCKSCEFRVPVFGLPARLCKADMVRKLVDLNSVHRNTRGQCTQTTYEDSVYRQHMRTVYTHNR